MIPFIFFTNIIQSLLRIKLQKLPLFFFMCSKINIIYLYLLLKTHEVQTINTTLKIYFYSN